jgi:hypothetical protein
MDLDQFALRYKCEYCTAGPGFWCRTLKGAKATMLHSDRTDGVRLAWMEGWEDANRLAEKAAHPLYTFNSSTNTGTSSGADITMDAS